ncbi:DegV family protein [Granulicatella seriolae]|uniref:DegV family protein n=1 Tax=Granulicatella seriolae TaxID=2967226 RepID=A0ABT1WP14_9LACT|nr:DegV family protein [Granulicatella seriolae]
MKIAIVADSTAYISKEEIETSGIYILPLSVIFGQETYLEDIEIDSATFYDKVRGANELPTTSQPPIGMVYDLFKKLAKEGYDAIISIHLSSKISGTHQSVVALSEDLKDEIAIYPVDSGVSCAVEARAVQLAVKLAKENRPPEEIVERIQHLLDESYEYFIVDDLSHLKRGGRLSAGAAAVGSLLKIKPILTFEDKSIVVFEKIRTQQKAMKRIEAVFEEITGSKDGSGYDIAIINGNCPDKGDKWIKEVKKKFPKATVHAEYFGPVIGTHLGEGSLGFTWAKTLDHY